MKQHTPHTHTESTILVSHQDRRKNHNRKIKKQNMQHDTLKAEKYAFQLKGKKK